MNNQYSNETKEQVHEKYQCGERIVNIAEEFKVSRTTIYRWIKNHEDNCHNRNKKVDMKTFHELERYKQFFELL